MRHEPRASEAIEATEVFEAVPSADAPDEETDERTLRIRPPESTSPADYTPTTPADHPPALPSEPAPQQPPEPAPQQHPELAPHQPPELAPQQLPELAPQLPEPQRQDLAPQPGRAAAALFGAVTVIPALLAAAWLLPGLPLLLAGRLTAPPLVFMFSPLAVGLCYFALRQPPARWPAERPDPADRPEPAERPDPAGPPQNAERPNRKAVPWWAVGATVAVAVAFAVWQIAERTQQVIALGDPATYLQTAAWIAGHGSLPVASSAAAFGGAHPGLTFASAGYYPSGTGLAPAVMAGTPLVLAAAIWLAGVPAALVLTPLAGACAVLSFGGLAGRLIGARWAPAAAAALALSLPEQYTSRGTFSEPLVQVLLFGGLCLLIDALVTPRPPVTDRTDPGQDRVLAALAGLVLGLAVLVRIDALSDILPAVPLLGLLLAARRRQGLPFGLGLAAGVAYGLAGGYLLARPYLDLTGPSLRPLGLITGGVLALTAVALTPPARTQLAKLPASQSVTTWLPRAAPVLVVAAFAALAIRALTLHHPDQNALVWVIWYLGLPALLLAAFGLAVLARRAARALLAWNDPGQQAWTWALPLLIALWVIVTVVWRPAISPEQPWASRRLVPFVLPGLILGAIWATAWLRQLAGSAGGGQLAGRARVTAGVVASCCAASLLIPATLTNLDLGSSPNASGSGRHLTANGMALRRIGPGELAAVNGLCAAIGPNAAVVILDSLTADRFAQVARGTCDTPTAIVDRPTAATVRAALSGIVRAGRRPVLMARDGALLAPYGGGPRPVINLATTQEAHDLTAPATSTLPIRYTVWLSDPAGA